MNNHNNACEFQFNSNDFDFESSLEMSLIYILYIRRIANKMRTWIDTHSDTDATKEIKYYFMYMYIGAWIAI